MSVEKIQHIKLSLMEFEDDSVLEPNKIDFIIRASISINLQDLDFEKTNESIGIVIKDMYDTLVNNNLNSNVNYLGIWVKVDNEVYDNSIKLEVLKQIDTFSAEKVNNLFEFLLMTIPD